MSYTDSVTGSAAYPDATLPAPTAHVDTVNAADHKALIQLIANKLEYLKAATAARTFWCAPPMYVDTGGTTEPVAQLSGRTGGAGSGGWKSRCADPSNPDKSYWYHTSTTAPTTTYHTILYDITDLCPAGFDIVSVGAVLDADLQGAAHGALPNNMPDVGLWKRSLGIGGAPGSWAAAGTDATDASASVAAYNLSHLVEQTINETIVTATQYAIAVTGEYGTNAVTNSPCVTGFKVVIG